MIFESQALAEAGLEHYLVRTAPEQGSNSPHFLMFLTPEELIDILQAAPEEYGCTHVVVNGILSRYFENAEGYSAVSRVEDFIKDLKRTFELE